MITYKVGDLISAAISGEVSVVGHGCNCFNTMGAGIAPKIAKAFHEAKEADQVTTKGDKRKLGGYSFAFSGQVGVFNLYTQYTYGGKNSGGVDFDYWALQSSLDKMSDHLKLLNGDKKEMLIGLPKIGSGLAGGDWDIISKIISRRLKDFNVVIYVLDKREIPEY